MPGDVGKHLRELLFSRGNAWPARALWGLGDDARAEVGRESSAGCDRGCHMRGGRALKLGVDVPSFEVRLPPLLPPCVCDHDISSLVRRSAERTDEDTERMEPLLIGDTKSSGSSVAGKGGEDEGCDLHLSGLAVGRTHNRILFFGDAV